MVHPAFSRDPDFARCFLREVRVTARLHSPHTVTVHDTGQTEQGQFILLFCATVAAMLLGLAISAAVDSADKAVMLMILVIIPQLLFGNAFIELKGVGKLLGQLFILAYWCHDGLKSLLPRSLLEEKNPATGGLVLFGHNSWGLDLFVILVFGALYSGLAIVFLRRKDGPYGKSYRIPWVK